MSTLVATPKIDYTASAELLARRRSPVTHTRSHTTYGSHHSHTPWGLIIGLIVLAAVIVGVVFLFRRRSRV